MFIQVAIDIPLFTTFTYEVPPAWRERIRPGQLVHVPFRNRSRTGLVMAVHATLEDPALATLAQAGKIKPLVDIVDPEPLLTERGLKFLEFVADYYFAPIGEVARLAIPAGARVEGMKHYRIREGAVPEATPEAPLDATLDATLDAPLDDSLAAALALLTERGAMPIRELRETFPDLTYLRLGELERLGLVDVFYEEDARAVRARTETFARRLRPLEPGERVGKSQAALLELLASGEARPLSELRVAVSGARASLNALAARGIVELWEEEVYRDPFVDIVVPAIAPVEPTPSQQRAIEAIRAAREAGRFEGFVLHGVTGSGKTEVYVRAIRETLEAGQRALVLLPEIALTPQFVGIFRAHFGEAIAVLHSGLTAAQKFDQWRRIKRDEVDIVIGARSAIFAPLERVGIIVVDEEHDPSFKQEEGPRYNARDMALVRGKLEGAQVVLGSATPVLESFYNARQGRLHYLPMPERVASRPLPGVRIVDMRGGRGATTHGGPRSVLSNELVRAIGDTLEAGMQAILFLNRRGYSPCVLCEGCGHVFRCPNCDVSLTYHRRHEALRCHHCDHAIRMPEKCPECQNEGIGRKGTGTERLEGQVQTLFPAARAARLDRDTGSGTNLQRILGEFRQGKLNLLVGTQMVTKGHDFPGVTTVGVVAADMSLNFPDFRAAERTFQLLTQVAGRAGRGDNPGQVYVQSFLPEHYSLQTARHHDYAAFAERELAMREMLRYPPFTHLIAIKFEAASEGATIQAARDYAGAIRRHLRRDPELGAHIFMLGPAMAPIGRINNRTRWQLLLKSPSRALLRKLAIAVLTDVAYFDPPRSPHRNVRIVVDVDPINLL